MLVEREPGEFLAVGRRQAPEEGDVAGATGAEAEVGPLDDRGAKQQQPLLLRLFPSAAIGGASTKNTYGCRWCSRYCWSYRCGWCAWLLGFIL